MAEIAGLTLSVVGVTALFSTCIECFDIVVAGKNFSEDYEQLCALFSLQRVRFGLWGESVGLIPNPIDGSRLRYNKNIDRPDISPDVERILNNIKSILDEAGKVDERYGLKADKARGSEVSTSRGLSIFSTSFDRFKLQIRKHQKESTPWHTTRWAIHDADKFEGMINRLKDFVDGLESITKSLGLLQEQHALLREEIESISDVESLRLLRDASSSRRSSQRDVSDTASRRLVLVEESIAEQITLSSTVIDGDSSFITAYTRPSAVPISVLGSRHQIPGAWPQSIISGRHSRVKPDSSCAECLEEHYKCEIVKQRQCKRCSQKQRSCSFMRDEPRNLETDGQPEAPIRRVPDTHNDEDLPQNQRLLSSLIERAGPRKPLSFLEGDAHYGEALAAIKSEDADYWVQHSANIIGQAHSGSSAAKRMFLELRNIRAAKIPFISATPLDDSLDKILASIEGPPETPYEGGVFWITVKLPESDPYGIGTPLMRFQTKIYHPNISPQGHICADYKEKWTAVLSAGAQSKSAVKDPAAVWYQGKSTEIRWSLGAILTALCGLLASPDVDDPLVPEIAQKYLENYDDYCQNARNYTRKFAMQDRPANDSLTFLEDSSVNEDTVVLPIHSGELEVDQDDRISLQRSLRERYDDKIDRSFSSSDKSAGSATKPSEQPIDSLQLAIQTTIFDNGEFNYFNAGKSVLPGIVATIRSHLHESQRNHFGNFQILHGLLYTGKGLNSISSHKGASSLNAHFTSSLMITVYAFKLSELARKATVKISIPDDSPYFAIDIYIPGEPPSTIRLERKMSEFALLSQAINATHPAANQFNLTDYLSEEDKDVAIDDYEVDYARNPGLMQNICPKLDAWFGFMFRNCQPTFWEVPQLLKFIMPPSHNGSDSDDLALRRIRPKVPRTSIPPEFLKGTIVTQLGLSGFRKERKVHLSIDELGTLIWRKKASGSQIGSLQFQDVYITTNENMAGRELIHKFQNSELADRRVFVVIDESVEANEYLYFLAGSEEDRDKWISVFRGLKAGATGY